MSAAEHWAEWEQALGERGLVSYRYVGCSSHATSPFTAEGGYRIRRDLRTAGGALLVAPLGIAMLDTAGINVDALSVVVPTQIDLSLLAAGRDMDRVAISGRVVRQGRTQMVTEAIVRDAGGTAGVVAVGTATWAVVGPCPEGYRYVDPGPGVHDEGDLPGSLITAFDAVSHPGGGYELAGLSPRVGAHSLHQGPIQVMLEAAALDAAGPGVAPVHTSTSIVARGTTGPFVATAEVVGTSGSRSAIRAVLRDAGAGDRVVALSFLTTSKQVPSE